MGKNQPRYPIQPRDSEHGMMPGYWLPHFLPGGCHVSKSMQMSPSFCLPVIHPISQPPAEIPCSAVYDTGWGGAIAIVQACVLLWVVHPFSVVLDSILLCGGLLMLCKSLHLEPSTPPGVEPLPKAFALHFGIHLHITVKEPTK